MHLYFGNPAMVLSFIYIALSVSDIILKTSVKIGSLDIATHLRVVSPQGRGDITPTHPALTIIHNHLGEKKLKYRYGSAARGTLLNCSVVRYLAA